MSDRYSTGNHTNTLKSHLTLKEEIRARDLLFRVIIDITKSLKKCCFISFYFLHTQHENLFDFPKFWFHSFQGVLIGLVVIKDCGEF